MERRLLIKGLLISGFFYIIIKTIHFKYYKNVLSVGNHKLFYESDININHIKTIKRSLKRITLIAPWKLTCLNKGITFKILSNSLNLDCSLSFDAIKLKNGNLIAHSYISRNNKIIYLGINRFKDANGLLTI